MIRFFSSVLPEEEEEPDFYSSLLLPLLPEPLEELDQEPSFSEPLLDFLIFEGFLTGELFLGGAYWVFFIGEASYFGTTLVSSAFPA